MLWAALSVGWRPKLLHYSDIYTREKAPMQTIPTLEVSSIEPRWMRRSKLAASVYFLACGLSALFAPGLWWLAAGLPAQQVPLLMGVIGTLMLSLSAGALAAAASPSQWGLPLVLFIACALDALLVLHALLVGTLPALNGLSFLLLDGVWIYLFLCMLHWSYEQALVREKTQPTLPIADALQKKPVGVLKSLGQLSHEKPLVLVFIRHTGCTFCRYHLELLAAERAQGAAQESQIVLVGMSPASAMESLREQYKLDGVLLVSDPERVLYRACGLRIGSFLDLLGPRQIFAALRSGALLKHGIGWLQGSGFQLQGAVVIDREKIVGAQLASVVSEYCALAPLAAKAQGVAPHAG
jgi:peroxiredoxin